MVYEIFILLFSLIFYILNQSRHLYGGDSAEYSLVAHTWSIPHAPGYPFYSLLLNLFRPANNIISITATILTAYVIFRTIQHLTKNDFVASFSSLFYLFLFPVWLYGELPEVFALNNLIVTLITYLILLYTQTGKKKYKFFIYFLIGTAVSHHHTFILFLPGWLFLIWKKKKDFFIRSIVFNLALFAFGISFYLYPVLSSRFNPPIDWENAKSLDGAIRLITRASYGTFKAYRDSVPNIINQFTNLFSTFILIIQDFKPLGVTFILVGLLSMFSMHALFSSFLLITLSIYLIFLFVTNFPLSSSFALATYERYLIAFYLLLIFPFGFGIARFLKLYDRFKRRFIQNKTLRSVLSSAIYVFLIVFFLVGFASNYHKMSLLKNLNDFDLFAKDLLDTPPQNAIVSFKGDISYFTASYYYYVKKYRNDLVFAFMSLADRTYYREKLKKSYPSLSVPSLLHADYETFIKEFFRLNEKRRQILFEKPVNIGIWVPYGLFWKYYPDKHSAKKDLEEIIGVNEKLWNKVYHIPRLNRERRDFLMLDSLQNYYLLSLYSYTELLKNDNRNEEAKKYLTRILDYNPRYVGAFQSLIDILLKENKCNEAKQYFVTNGSKIAPEEISEQQLQYKRICK